MKTKLSYLDFLNRKINLATQGGFEIEDAEVSQILKPHQRDAPTLFDITQTA